MKYLFLIMVCLLVGATYSCNGPEPEIYLIPNDFRGRVVILINQKNGISREYEGSSRVYKIPASGVLKTKFSSNTGSFDLDKMKFYYADSVSREEIPIFKVQKDTTLSTSQIFYYANGIFADRKIEYIEFIVAPYYLKDSFFSKNADGVLIENESFKERVDKELDKKE